MRNPSELRQAYVVHVQKMLELLGDAPAVAATEAQSVLRIETALAKGSLTQVERRDPKLLYHKMSRQELEGAQPVIPLEGVLCPGRPAGAALAQCDRAGILQSHGRRS